ncbi:hypothetical protein [Dehalogenimonas alkenigignens]|uniref:Uncharacterized protein n=1 Tax=Dehalogenimonas alkenigignens TaxID=1217799 RepID=A0A0W0GIF5_9CHLR|nr:hypothetical protein [Dehalogenimonas alkenigignens]KTB48322.1 hypothetical protein DEALK_11680 [Dehalogenimonas alkenigignens]
MAEKPKQHTHAIVEPTLENLSQQLSVLDERLDNMDSILTNVAERVMSQPITLSVTCSGCGKTSTYTLLACEKPTIRK